VPPTIYEIPPIAFTSGETRTGIQAVSPGLIIVCPVGKVIIFQFFGPLNVTFPVTTFEDELIIFNTLKYKLETSRLSLLFTNDNEISLPTS
jgi:hypothetical protein